MIVHAFRRGMAALAVALVAVACSPFSGSDQPVPGSVDAGIGNGAVDAAGPDAMGAGTGDFCAHAATIFCDDFEGGHEPYLDPSNDPLSATAFKIVADPRGGSGHVLSMHVDDGDAGGLAAFLVKSLDTNLLVNPKQLRLRYQVSVKSTNSGFAEIGGFATTYSNGQSVYGPATFQNSVGTQSTGASNISDLGWHDVEVVLTPAVATADSQAVLWTVSFDGAILAKGMENMTSASIAALYVWIGVFYVKKNAAVLDVLYDNVIVDAPQ